MVLKYERGSVMKTKYLANPRLSLMFFIFIWILYSTVYMTKNCYSAAMADIVNDGIMTKTQTGIINAVFYLVYAPFQIVGGKFADRFRPESLVTVGLIGSAIANTVVFLNQNYFVMLGAWAFNAAVQFAVWPSIFKIITTELAPRHRGMAVFYITFSSNFGLIVAYIVAVFVSDWKYNFLISAVALVFFAIALLLVYSVTEKKMVPDESVKTIANVSKGEKKDKAESRRMFLKSGFYFFLPVVLIRQLFDNSVKVLSPTMLMENYADVSPDIGNLLNIIIIVAGMVGVFVVNLLRIKGHHNNEMKGYTIIFILLTPIFVLLLFIGKIPMFVAVIALALISAITSGGSLLHSHAAMRFAAYGKTGESSGITNAASSFGIVVQSYGIAQISEFGWQPVFFTFIGLAIASIITMMFITPRWQDFFGRK